MQIMPFLEGIKLSMGQMGLLGVVFILLSVVGMAGLTCFIYDA